MGLTLKSTALHIQSNMENFLRVLHSLEINIPLTFQIDLKNMNTQNNYTNSIYGDRIKNLKNEEGIANPRSLGREKLVERIAEYVEKSQGTIRDQIRKMGTSCDWSRERYTMDASLNRCVNETFKKISFLSSFLGFCEKYSTF